ncbi:hypothetical protein IJ101_01055 [Candidatus Saccharibacteria bacterium]|nr:hypothetical protein [Candidatus Saccharibacteria bacterium]
MFFDSVEQIKEIASRTGCAIFVVPKDVSVEISGAILLQPEEKSIITIEQVRNVISRLSVKQFNDVFVLVRPADLLGEDAANAFLKNLEEPKEKVHFVLITDSPSRLLPTILSRAEIYFLRQKYAVDGDLTADAKMRDLAKRLIVAKPAELVKIADEMTKKKDGVRAYVLSVLGTTIEMLFKSYFKTEKSVFVEKIPKFLACYEAIERNGHIKLHLVADLI